MNDMKEECQFCGSPVQYGQKECGNCGRATGPWRVPGKTQCGNCHAYLKPDDKYCRICGTKAGEGAFKPYQEIMQCIYGPMPVERIHTCRKCGYTWKTCLMVDKESFCPKCGGEAPYKENRAYEIGIELIM